MTKIIGFAGKIGSGKTTQMRFLHGFFMKHLIPSPFDISKTLTDNYKITHDGKLHIHAQFEDGLGFGEIDVRSKDPGMYSFLSEAVYPYIKGYSVADTLKSIAIQLFDIPEECIYGSQQEKLKETHLRWEDWPTSGNTGNMTGREFMQNFGTNICRRLYPDIWINATTKSIFNDSPQYAVIDDVRFDNEREIIQSSDGVVLYLDRVEGESSHESENSITKEKCDFVVPCKGLGLGETCLLVLKTLQENNVIPQAGVIL